MRYKIVILGCTRSGTTATVERLNRAGLKVGHESLLSDGGVGLDLGFQRLLRLWHGNTDHVLLQVREPWACISSAMSHGLKHHGRFMAEVNQKGFESHRDIAQNWYWTCLWCAQYWLRWNRYCLTLTEKWYRVEDLNMPDSDGCRLLESAIGQALPDATNLNARKHVWLTREAFSDWPDLVAEIDALASFFGYDSGNFTTSPVR